MEPLYELLEDTLSGLRLSNQSDVLSVVVCGYAEDIADVLQALTRFGEASWVVIITSKSVAVHLCDGACIESDLLHGVRLMHVSSRC